MSANHVDDSVADQDHRTGVYVSVDHSNMIVYLLKEHEPVLLKSNHSGDV